jgi:hypothetical protein
MRFKYQFSIKIYLKSSMAEATPGDNYQPTCLSADKCEISPGAGTGYLSDGFSTGWHVCRLFTYKIIFKHMKSNVTHATH